MKKNAEFFALDKNFKLAEKVASRFGKKIIIPEIVYFADSEIRIDLPKHIDLQAKEIYIIHSTAGPVNQNYMKLFFLTDLLERKGAYNVHAVIPYFGYARQCGCKKGGGIGHAKIIAELIESCGINKVFSVEIHDQELQTFFTIPFENILLRDFIAQKIKDLLPNYREWCLVAPDEGAKIRVEEIAEILGIDKILFSKERIGVDKVKIAPKYIGACEGKNAIIIDDIISTGNTAVKIAQLLYKHRANKIYGFFIHPVISGQAIAKLDKSPIEKIFVTNSVQLQSTVQDHEEQDKIKVLDISEIIAQNIK